VVELEANLSAARAARLQVLAALDPAGAGLRAVPAPWAANQVGLRATLVRGWSLPWLCFCAAEKTQGDLPDQRRLGEASLHNAAVEVPSELLGRCFRARRQPIPVHHIIDTVDWFFAWGIRVGRPTKILSPPRFMAKPELLARRGRDILARVER
jgi:hypothetical protein